MAGGAGCGDNSRQLVEAGVVSHGSLAERGETGTRCDQGVGVPVEADDPKITTGLEQGRRMAGAALRAPGP